MMKQNNEKGEKVSMIIRISQENHAFLKKYSYENSQSISYVASQLIEKFKDSTKKKSLKKNKKVIS